MKNLFNFFLITAAMACLISCSGNGSEATANKENAPADSAKKESYFGAKINGQGAINMDSLKHLIALNPEAAGNIKVTGTVESVCQNKGCWMKLNSTDGSPMRVTFKDYGFFVPKDCSGKTAVINGRAYMDTTSVEDLRHFAEDAGKSKEEIGKINQPKIELAFEADGVIIR